MNTTEGNVDEGLFSTFWREVIIPIINDLKQNFIDPIIDEIIRELRAAFRDLSKRLRAAARELGDLATDEIMSIVRSILDQIAPDRILTNSNMN
jgi:hypothetical protein